MVSEGSRGPTNPPPPPAGEPGALPFDPHDIEQSIGDRFRHVVRIFPERVAVREHGRSTTYAELAASAGRVANALVDRIGGKHGPVALMLDPGAPFFAAMLGALEGGRFYVPLDPLLPPARLQAVVRELDAAAALADDANFDRARALLPASTPVWRVEDLQSGESTTPAVSVSPGELAYVLFTSGSTGVPKGVMQSHRNVLDNVRKLASGLAIRPEDRLTLLSSPGNGASVSDIFGALLTGASVCPYALSGDGLRRLPEFLTREGITILHCVPSVFRSFSWTLDGREDLSKLRLVKLGGEAVLAPDFELYRNRFPRSCVFHVGLGATEINVIRQWFARHDTPWPGGSPLGYPVDGTEVVLLDEEGQPAEGEGEIGVIARTLAVGYWKDPAHTASAFLAVAGRPGVRLHRTGDLGRMLPDGCLLHAGRKDSRIKIRGHRVETSEVEAALATVPGVVEACVEGRDSAAGTRLVAWVVRRGENPPGIASLRKTLSERLPAHMLPSSFVFVDALPRTPAGKVDRLALPDPSGSRPAFDSDLVEPRTLAESSSAAVFARVLGLDRVGAEDDFFELGGDSLSAVELLAGLSSALGVELSAADLLEAPTPAGLAARAVRGGARPQDGLVRLRTGQGRPILVIPGGAGDGEDLFSARRLSRLVGGRSPFLCFRSGPAPHPSVGELAGRCVRQLRAEAARGPYTIVGDCVGGILALEVARRLRQEGEEVALLALLDTPYPALGRRLRGRLLRWAPWLDRLARRFLYFRGRLGFHAGVLRALPSGRLAYARRVAGVGARGIAPEPGRGGGEGLDRRASYVGTLLSWEPPPFQGKIHLVESEEAGRRGFGAAWSRLASGAELVRVPGDHRSFILEHGELVAAALRRWLASAA